MGLIWCKSQEICFTEGVRAKVYCMITLCLDLNNYTKNKAISFLFLQTIVHKLGFKISLALANNIDNWLSII